MIADANLGQSNLFSGIKSNPNDFMDLARKKIFALLNYLVFKYTLYFVSFIRNKIFNNRKNKLALAFYWKRAWVELNGFRYLENEK